MLHYAMLFVGGCIALFLLDRLLGFALRWLAPILPDEVAGHDGWLVDTHAGTGIFDRRSA